MNKPVEIETARIVPAAPVVLVPVPQPARRPAAPRGREKSGSIAGLLSLAVVAAIGVAWWLSPPKHPSVTPPRRSRAATSRAR